jgi:hypothetical protein
MRKVYLSGHRNTWGKLPDKERYQRLACQANHFKLLSYAWMVRRGKPNAEMKRFFSWPVTRFLDSGAFTAYTQGRPVDLAAYADFCLAHAGQFETLSNVDAIGGGEDAAALTYANQKFLEGEGLKPLPVFHCREPTKWLERYIAEGYDYIALGGMVPENAPYLRCWLDDVFSRFLCDADGVPRVRVHGFGLTRPKLILRYPWHSVGSSAWLHPSSFGNVTVRQGGDLFTLFLSKNTPGKRGGTFPHYRKLGDDERRTIDATLAECGVTAEDCEAHYCWRDIANMAAIQSLSDLIPDRLDLPEIPLF